MAKILVILFCLAVPPVLSIVSMIYGWGLEPRSWGWIILCYLCLYINSGLVEVAKKW